MDKKIQNENEKKKELTREPVWKNLKKEKKNELTPENDCLNYPYLEVTRILNLKIPNESDALLQLHN